MRISKHQLRELIKEEVERTFEGYEWGEEEDDRPYATRRDKMSGAERHGHDTRDTLRKKQTAADAKDAQLTRQFQKYAPTDAERETEKKARKMRDQGEKNQAAAQRRQEKNAEEFRNALAKYYPDEAAQDEKNLGRWATVIAKDLRLDGGGAKSYGYKTFTHPIDHNHMKKWAKMKGLPEVEPEERGIGQKLGSFFKGKGFKEELEKIVKEEVHKALTANRIK